MNRLNITLDFVTIREKEGENVEKRIMVVDDDVSILVLLSDVLRENGFSVTTASTGEACLGLLQRQKYDLIILDIMMKGLSGLDVCRRIRSSVSGPILLLSAKDTSMDIINGLSLGADDYLTKPFVLEELVARINAHLRRETRALAPGPAAKTMKIGDITLNPAEMSAAKAGEPVSLSTREFELLSYLMQNAGQTLSKERIFRDVWGTEYGEIGTVAINIKNLREKIDPTWRYIKTVWGSGYCFVTQSGFIDEEEKDRTGRGCIHENEDSEGV